MSSDIDDDSDNQLLLGTFNITLSIISGLVWGNMYRKPLDKMGKPMSYCILKCFPSTNPVNLL